MALMLGIPNHGSYLDGESPRALLDLATHAEAAGVDTISVVDHVVMGSRPESYPYGSFPGRPGEPWLEPLTTLTAIAAVTHRIRLATGILIAPLRPPALLAKAAATLDVLSEGRLELGVGTGWQAEEYEAVGLRFAQRHTLLDDTMAACQALWQGGPTDFSSETVSFEQIYCSPLPRRQGGVPFWIGGKPTPRNLRRIVRYGSGWIPSPADGRDTVIDGIKTVHAALDEAGREHDSVRIRVSPPAIRDQRGRLDMEASMAVAATLLEAGGTDVFLLLQSWCPNYRDVPAFLNELVPAARAIGRH